MFKEVDENYLLVEQKFIERMDESIIRSMKTDNMYIVNGLIVNQIDNTIRLEDSLSTTNYCRYYIEHQRINVFSIFKRTVCDDTNVKVNTFIYALKDYDGWRFDITDEEIVRYVRRFLEVCDSIDKRYDTIIVVPSHHDINRRFMKVIASRVKANDIIEDMFLKSTKGEALASLDVDGIENFCDEKYPRTSDYMKKHITDEIRRAFNRMTGKYFEAKKMPKEYLKFIKEPVTVNKGFSMDEAKELINNKSVLVLDDTLSTGASVSACVRVINQFEPKRLDVITLLSKKFKK